MSAVPDLLVEADAAARLLSEIAPSLGVLPAIKATAQASRLSQAIVLSAPLAHRVWTASELGEHLHVSAATVRGWIDDGVLSAFNVGRGSVPHWRITDIEALRFAEARRKKPGPGS